MDAKMVPMNTINNRQIFFILLMTLTCFSVVTIAKEMAQSAGRGAWITLLATAAVFALAAAVIVKLGSMHKEQTLMEYGPSLVTKPVTYLLAFFYVLYYLLILVFLISSMTKVVRANFLLLTPQWALGALSIPLFCYIAYKGISTVARLAELVGIAYLITAVFVHALMVAEGKIDRILPVFNAADIGRYFEGFRYSAFAFLGVEALLMMPLSSNCKKPVRWAVLALLAIGVFYVFVVETCFMQIGVDHIIKHTDALIVAIRDATPQMLEVVARMDILYLTVGFSAQFVGIGFVLTVIVEILCRVFKNLSRLAAVIGAGVAAFFLFVLADSLKDFEESVEALGTVLGLIGAFAIPFGLLLIAKAKNRKGKVNNGAG
jgi:spore germination protein